jgi:hypothetical protein
MRTHFDDTRNVQNIPYLILVSFDTRFPKASPTYDIRKIEKTKQSKNMNPNHTCAFNLPFMPSFLLYLILTALAPDAVAPINAAEFLEEKSVL